MAACRACGSDGLDALEVLDTLTRLGVHDDRVIVIGTLCLPVLWSWPPVLQGGHTVGGRSVLSYNGLPPSIRDKRSGTPERRAQDPVEGGPGPEAHQHSLQRPPCIFGVDLAHVPGDGDQRAEPFRISVPGIIDRIDRRVLGGWQITGRWCLASSHIDDVRVPVRHWISCPSKRTVPQMEEDGPDGPRESGLYRDRPRRVGYRVHSSHDLGVRDRHIVMERRVHSDLRSDNERFHGLRYGFVPGFCQGPPSHPYARWRVLVLGSIGFQGPEGPAPVLGTGGGDQTERPSEDREVPPER